jgi:hypothetical protein
MTTIEVVNFHKFMMGLSERKFNGKLSYTIYRNLNMVEPIVKQYYEDITALAKAFNIEAIDRKYNFEGDSQKEFQQILNKVNSVELHKVDSNLVFEHDFSAIEISMLDYMIEKN